MQLEASVDRMLASPVRPGSSVSALNDRLARMEQLLTDDEGMPDTRWYRHVFYGWNIYSLYDGQPFPGLAEAIRVRNQGQTERELGRVVRALDRLVKALHDAQALIDGGPRG